LTRELNDIRYKLGEMAEKESLRLFRMARRAEAKGVSRETIKAIREEAFSLAQNYATYPERLLMWNAKTELKYAFCGERLKHHYITVNEDNKIVKEEWK